MCIYGSAHLLNQGPLYMQSALQVISHQPHAMYLSEYFPRINEVKIAVDVKPETDLLIKLSTNGCKMSLEFGKRISKQEAAFTEKFVMQIPVDDAQVMKNMEIKRLQFRQDVFELDLLLSGAKDAAVPFTSVPESNSIWSTHDLLLKTPRNDERVNEFRFLCKECDHCIIDSLSYKFMDMPLEHWYELMDLWHCHKPHQEKDNSAGNRYEGNLLPRSGQVNIGTTYFSILGDYSACPNCRSSLGTREGEATKINKWLLKLSYKDKTEIYHPYYLAFFTLVDKVNNTGRRKYLIKAPDRPAIYIWLIGIGTHVAFADQVHDFCLKILYGDQSLGETDEVADVPIEVYDSLSECFAKNTALLPSTCQTMKHGDKLYKVAHMATK